MSVLFSRSKICGFFSRIASALFGKAETSIIGKIFSSYNDKVFERGLLGRLTQRLDLGKRVFRPVKRTVSKHVSQSLLLKNINDYLKGFLFTKLNVYGLISVTVGIGFLLVEILKFYSGAIQQLSFLDTFISILLCMISVPLLFSSSTVSEAVSASKNTSRLLFEWLGCKSTLFENKDEIKGHTRTALPLALVLCLASWWIRPLLLLMGIIVFIAAITVFYSPETGVVLFVFFLPFLYFEKAAIFVIYVAICFFFKYIRGKRTVKFDPLSVSALMFAILVLFSYITTDYRHLSREATVQFLFAIGAFFVFINLIKSKKWIRRCISSIVGACLLVSLYGVTGYLVQYFDVPYFEGVFRSFTDNIGISFFGEKSYLSHYLILLMPFVLFVGEYETKSEKAIRTLAFFGGSVCLFLAGNISSLLCLIAAVLLFFMIYSKKSLAFMLFGLCMIPILIVGVPSSIVDKGEILKAISEVVSVNVENVTEQLKVFPSVFCGTGLGTFDSYPTSRTGLLYKFAAEVGLVGLFMFVIMLFFVLQKNVTVYSKGCSKNGKVISLTAISSITALLLDGRADVFADYRVCFMFWICIGIASCVSVTERNMTNAFDRLEDSEF